jgi:hypothetical protein
VAQAQRADRQGVLDAVQPGGLAGVHRERHVLGAQQVERLGLTARGEPVLRAGDVEADHAGVAVADGEPGGGDVVVGLAHGVDQGADADPVPGGRGLADAAGEAGLHGLDDGLQGSPPVVHSSGA